jgi:HAD superfamily hydrolase (TIGR01450 family)
MKEETILDNMLNGIKFFIFDVDGTLILGSNPLLYAAEIIKLLQRTKTDFVILSNNSSYSTVENKERLEEVLDVNLSLRNIYTSIQGTIDFLINENISQCYIVGTPSMIKEFEDKGISFDDINPQAIILGFDRTLTYKKIESAALYLQREERIPFFATHPDDTCPIDKGRIPDVGSFLKMFEQATGRIPDKILGKPNKMILELSLKGKNVQKNEVLVVGDRLETDIRMAYEAGVKSSLVLTGATSETALNLSEVQPSIVWGDLKPLFDNLSKKDITNE